MPTGVMLIGGGDRAETYLTGITQEGSAHLVGILDGTASHIGATGREASGVRLTHDLEEALAWPGVSACIVCAAPDARPGLGEALAEAGKHVLMVEPFIESPDEARRLHSLFTQRDLVLMPATPERYRDVAMTVRSQIDQGNLGRIVFLRFAYPGGPPAAGPPPGSGPRTGTTIPGQAEEAFDLVCSWVGDAPSSVYAMGGRHLTSEAPDYTSVTVGFREGATAVLEFDGAPTAHASQFRHVYLLGTEGAIDISWDKQPNVIIDAGASISYPSNEETPHLRQIRSWLEAVQAGKTGGGPSIGEALTAVAVRSAAQSSLNSGDIVSLAPDPGGA